MENKFDITIGDKFTHLDKGLCIFTETAYALECMNPNPNSLFLLVDGENRETEVSINCLTELEEDVEELCQNCFAQLKEGEFGLCYSCAKMIVKKLGVN